MVRKLLALVAALALLAGLPAAAGAQTQRRTPLTNLAHLDFLGDLVAPPAQEGHTTYALDTEPELGVLWTYSEPQADGTYNRIGGGTYDPVTDTYTQGAYNADDISRAAVVYLRHWRQFGDAHSRERAYQLLRGLTYLQTATGPNAGNVVLWMQPDGTLNPSAEPVELPDPSDSGPSYWLARTLWALGEGYAAFRDADPAFAAFLGERLDLSLGALERQVLEPEYGTTQTVDGLEWPAWLIVEGADASSEAVYGLTAAAQAGNERARAAAEQLADGLARMQLGDARTWPFGALMPWAESRSVWHAWGDQMAGALATAGRAFGRGDWVTVATGEVGRFTPHLIASGGPENGWLPAPAERVQIAYGADATLQNLLRTAEAARQPAFRDLAGVHAAWWFGNNPAGEAMYDPATGRTFDGIEPDGRINRNSGAESTIHGLLSMLALDSRPDVARRAQVAERGEHVTWQVVDAEDGVLTGDATAVTPPSAWTGESLWTGGGYVELGAGGAVASPVTLPVDGGYWLFGVIERQQVPTGTVGTAHALGGLPAGRLDHGGAGAQGITEIPGFLDIATAQVSGDLTAGASVVTSTYDGTGAPARLDAVLVQPEVEWLVLGGAGSGQAVLRSFATGFEERTVAVPGCGLAVARSYDERGRVVDAEVDRGAEIDARVAPGGFTVVSRFGRC